MSLAISILSSLFASALTYLIVLSLRPKLKINPLPLNGTDRLQFSIENLGKYDAYNIQVEACAYYQGNAKSRNQTYHLEVATSQFLILPSKSTDPDFSKIFYSNSLKISTLELGVVFNDIISDLTNDKCQFRIRVHAQHSVSGLGRSFQKKFRFIKNQFKEVE